MDDVRGRQWSVGGGRTFTELPDWIRRLLRLRQPAGLRDFGHGMVGNRERTTALAVVRPDSGARLVQESLFRSKKFGPTARATMWSGFRETRPRKAMKGT